MANPQSDARRLLSAKEKAKQLAVLNEFKKIRERLNSDIADLMKRIALQRKTEGNASPSLLIQKARLNDLLNQVTDEIRSASGRLGIIAEQSQRSAVKIAKTDAGNFAKLGADLTFFDADATRELIGIAGNGKPLDLVFRNLAPTIRQRVFNALFYGVAAGISNEQIAREIGQAIGTGTAGAMTIVRTETNRAYREATRKFYQQTDGVTGWRWLAVLDLRTCPICWALHGSIFKTKEKMATHPNCRCTMTPVFKGDEKQETGPEKFAKLNRAQQMAILGPEKLKLYELGARLSDFHELHKTPFGFGRRIKPLVNIEFDRNPRTPAPGPFPDAARTIPTPKTATSADKKKPKAVIPSSFAAGDPVPDFDSWDDAQNYMSARYPKTKFDFGMTDVRVMNETTKEIARLFDQYPEVSAEMKYVGTYDDPQLFKEIGASGKFVQGEFAHARHPDLGPGYIGLNPRWYRDGDFFAREIKRSEGLGWLVDGRVKSVMTHEFGHATDGYLTKTVGSNNIVPFNYADGKAISVRDLKNAILRKYKPTRGEISDYAMQNKFERFAEGFAQFHKGSGTRSALADMIDKFFQFVRNNKTFTFAERDTKGDWSALSDAEQRAIRREINNIYEQFGLTKPFKTSEL
jgi:SPP1 gp7 family putative phage head morphogenesis protein